MIPPPVLKVREWSTTTPDTSGGGALLRDVQLSRADRALIAELDGRASLRFTELRSGLSVSVGPHVGTVNLTSIRLVILPKLRLDNLMRMVAYAFDLSDLLITETRTTYESADHGLIDLLGISLLRAVERIVRGGLLSTYQSRNEDLSTPRGRLDLRHIATHPRRATLRCTYDDLTVDHELNQVLAAGLRLAASVMESRDLRLDLARAADRFFGDLERRPLSGDWLEAMLSGLDRRSSHYRTALTLVALIHHGARLGQHIEAGSMPLSSFMLNMNMVFERFLGRYLSDHSPDDVRIGIQDVRSDVFTYLENGGGWNQPTIRPDFVFRRRKQVVAVADAKYKNRHENPPSSAELYQLTTYGLAYAMPEPREVLLLHPLARGESDRATTLLFAPSAAGQHVRIRLVGVPVDDLLDGTVKRWWPLAAAASVAAVPLRVVSSADQFGVR
jgi:5-methylcytosine-specific restriction enzyme subunit McrC